jgi:hypothetical protein
MKTSSITHARRLLRLAFLIVALGIFAVPAARAGLTVDVHLYHNNFGYYFYPYLSANANPPDFPDGVYQIASPQIPANGSRLVYYATNSTISQGYNGDYGGGSYYGTYDDIIYGVTNGLWTITVTNASNTNVYFFPVTVTGLTSDIFGPPPQAVYPTSGQMNVPNQPLIQWTGPSWAGTLYVEDDSVDSNGNGNYVASEYLSPDATSWIPGAVLPDGTNRFSVTYQTNVTTLITANQPTNTSGQPISGWVSTATLEAQFVYGNEYNVTFTVGSSQSQSNLVVNGGFETGDFTGWDGGGNDVDDGSDSDTIPHTGDYEAEFGSVGELGYISQTLSTTPGATYLLSFWLNSPDGQTPNEFQVSWNGTTLFDETDIPAIGWTNIQFVVTATGSSTELQFGAQDDPSYLALDDVSVVSSQSEFDPALGTTNLTWSTGGDLPWFTQTSVTEDGLAAQSGAITDGQASYLETTVPADGQISFDWKVSSENGWDYLTFYINGDEQDAISGEVDWNQETYPVSAGDTLRWEYTKDPDCCAGGLDAGFLDNVIYAVTPPDNGPIITFNPFNQTNYPGYNVALLAAATSNPAATWQWFEVGSASPIPNATSALFIPTNSGTAGVAGSYYAVASNTSGTANTTTAAVTFVSASLPPDWSFAAKSPLQAVDASTYTRDYYLGCAVDPAGDLYAAAQYNGNMAVLTNGYYENVLTAPGNYAAALVKHGPNGTPLWGVGLTNNDSTGSSYGIAVAAAPGNGAYLAADISGTNWLGTNKFVDTGGNSILLSRFDAGGSNVWSKFIGGTNFVYTSYDMLAADPSGNVTLAGFMSGTVNFGGTNLSSSSQVGFLIQYDASGMVRWAQTIPVSPWNLAYGSGLLFVSLQSTVSGGVTNASIGSVSNVTDRAWVVACLNATNGQALWLRGAGDQYGANYSPLYIIDHPLVSCSGSDVFMMGNGFGSAVAFGGLSVPLPGGRGQYFARYDTNGNAQVATVFGSASTMIWDSAANASGVYVTGDFDDYSQFGSLVVAAPVYTTNDLGTLYFTQPLVAKLDRNGSPLWARNGVSSAFANFRGIGLASDGVWACGFLQIANSILAKFGTYSVYSDYQDIGFTLGTIYYHQGGLLAKITDNAAAALPVTLLNPLNNGANFQFQFLSQSGFTHTILYRTNLTVGSWLSNSTINGDGTVTNISLPFSLFSPAKQGFIRVSTQ